MTPGDAATTDGAEAEARAETGTGTATEIDSEATSGIGAGAATDTMSDATPEITAASSDHHLRVDQLTSRPREILIVVANPTVSSNNHWPVGFWGPN